MQSALEGASEYSTIRGNIADVRRKPRIAVVTDLFPVAKQPYRGRAIYDRVLCLSEWADVRVFCAIANYPRGLKPSRFSLVHSDPTFCPPDVSAEYFEFSALPGLSRPMNGYVCAARLTPRLRAWHPDLILSYWLYPHGFASVIAGRKMRIPVLVGAVGSDLRCIRDLATAWFTRRALQAADGVITVSEELRTRAVQMGAPSGRVRTIMNGCDASLFKVCDKTEARAELGVPADTRLILYVGWLDRNKGIEDLLGSVRLLRRLERLFLVCVGEGPLKATLERLAQKLRIADRVQLVGAVEPRDVARWMAACDVVCLPSHSEGCPSVILEAINSGRPVVATSVGGVPEIVNRHCGILVPAHDTKALSRALVAALNKDWDGRLIAQQFRRGWREVARETFDVCRTLLAVPGTRSSADATAPLTGAAGPSSRA